MSNELHDNFLYHRLFGTQERIDLKILCELYDRFKEDVFINANIRRRIEILTEPRPLTIHMPSSDDTPSKEEAKHE